MLVSISLENFQAHKQLKLAFTNGVNAITGLNDIGKSSVIRALRWVCLNQPRGTEGYIKHGEKRVTVTLEVRGPDGEIHTIVRSRTKSKNTYALDGEEFAAFRGDVPEQIQRVLAMSDINFQSQNDSQFFVGWSASEANRYLLSLADLTLVHEASKAARVGRAFSSQEVANVQDILESIERTVDELGWTERAMQLISTRDKAAAEAAVTRQQAAALERILTDGEDLRRRGMLLSAVRRTAEALRERIDERAAALVVLQEFKNEVSQYQRLQDMQAPVQRVLDCALLLRGSMHQLRATRSLLSMSREFADLASRADVRGRLLAAARTLRQSLLDRQTVISPRDELRRVVRSVEASQTALREAETTLAAAMHRRGLCTRVSELREELHSIRRSRDSVQSLADEVTGLQESLGTLEARRLAAVVQRARLACPKCGRVGT